MTFRRKLRLISLSLLALVLIIAGLLAFPFYLDVPDKLTRPLASRSIYARDGSWMGSTPSEDHYRQEVLPPDKPLPELIVRALLVSEDKRFFEHYGFDPLALARALRDNVQAGRVLSGASTLSMQLAKMMLPASESRNLARKIHETLLARRMEMSYDKEALLRAYLNHADFGRLCRGIETAARYYFGKPAAELQLHEAALLIVQLRNPSYFSPFKHPKRALEARNRLLTRLDADAATRELPLGLNPAASRVPEHLRQRAGTLTIDPMLQELAEQVVQEEVQKLKKRNVGQAAVLIVDNATGDILASVASANRDDPAGGQLDGTRVARSAGSTLKPFVYLLALRAGKHPASIYPDLPTPFPDARGIEAPSNFNDSFLGPISMRTALASSQNIPALLALNEHGKQPALLALLRELGYDIPEGDYGLGLAIGNAHVTLMQQAAAFCTLARGGLAIPLRLYKDSREDITAAPPVGERLISAAHAYQLSSMLSDKNARTAGFGMAPQLSFRFPCAVKTGTSSNFRDNWCIAYTPRYTVAVWVGNFDQSPMKEVSGLTGAGPIMHRLMSFLHEYESPQGFGDPASLGLTRVELDPRTGQQAPATMTTSMEWLTEQQLPSTVESEENYDRHGRALLPIEYRDWYQAQGQRNRDLYAIDLDRQLGRAPRIHMPADGTVIYLDDSLRHGGRIIPLRSNLHPDRVRWHCDTLRIYQKQGIWYAELSEGTHRIEAMDPRRGEQTHSTLHVR